MTDKEIEIDIQDKPQKSSVDIQLPLNFLTFGEVENDDAKIYIKQNVYKALENFAASNTSRELGSILIGEYSIQMNKTHIIISDFIEAKYTDASASTLTFTHETWDYVHKKHESDYSEKKIIGWQHTHPNYGIFLSNYDMFIQENFFNMPFQVAYVIDPIQNLRGFFQWKCGRVEKLKGYYIYDDIGKPIKIEQTKKKTDTKRITKPSYIGKIVVSLLCVLSLILSVSCFSLYREYRVQLEGQEAVLSQLNNHSNIIANQEVSITKLQEQLANSMSTVDELNAIIEKNEVELKNQDTVIKELQALVNNFDEDIYVHFIAYTVAAGDSISKICADNGIDYAENYKLILSVNGITDADSIYVGQTILIPIYN